MRVEGVLVDIPGITWILKTLEYMQEGVHLIDLPFLDQFQFIYSFNVYYYHKLKLLT